MPRPAPPHCSPQASTRSPAAPTCAGGEPAQAGAVQHPERLQHGHRVPGQVRLRRQLQRLRRSTTSATPRPPQDRQPGAVPGLAERRLGLRQPALPLHRLVAHRRLVQQHRASPRRSRRRGRASRSSTSATRRNPRYVKAVETDCGSHTHTLVPGKRPGRTSTSTSRRTPRPATLPGLPAAARHDLDHQGAAAAPDRGGGRRHARSCSRTAATPADNRQLRDHRLPRHHRVPGQGHRGRRLHGRRRPARHLQPRGAPGHHRVRDTANFAFWHSATFNNAGTKVVFTDELGGGGGATCNPSDRPDPRAPTPSTTSRQGRPAASWCSGATSRSRAPTPTPRTASRTTAR